MRTSLHHQSEAQPPNGPLTAATSPDTPSTCPARQSALPAAPATLHPILQNTASALTRAHRPVSEVGLRHTLFLQLLYPMVVIIRDCRSERHRSGHSDLS